MQYIVIGVVAFVSLVIVSRILGKGQKKLLDQYEVLQKRFGFELRTFKSIWGEGIKERHALEGTFSGYSIKLYDHFQEEGGNRVSWTSLTFETLFADELQLQVEFANTDANARFASIEEGHGLEVVEGVDFIANGPNCESLLTDKLVSKLSDFAKKEHCGAVSLSKGFLEYRETGRMHDEAMRTRFQDALLLLAELADAVSVLVVERKR